jgi:predicted Zn-dependent protease with MMP-like domain
MRSSERHLFHRLLVVAEREVQKTIGALPPKLRARARVVPVVYEPRPDESLSREGIAPDSLGLFVGETFCDAYAGAHDLPAQVILYLMNIWEYANHDARYFREEVRRTYLHELGHYLGLDEDDLAERDLD